MDGRSGKGGSEAPARAGAAPAAEAGSEAVAGAGAEGPVAVVVRGADGAVAGFGDGALLEFWSGGPEGWAVVRTSPLRALERLSPPEVRRELEAVARGVSGAAVVVAAEFRGLAFGVLSRAGPALCEAPELGPGALGAIVGAALAPDPGDAAPAAPRETYPGSGVFLLDLAAALAAAPELSSKRILRPFFDREAFAELRVLFDHEPPWLAEELAARGLAARAAEREGGVELTIFPERTRCT